MDGSELFNNITFSRKYKSYLGLGLKYIRLDEGLGGSLDARALNTGDLKY